MANVLSDGLWEDLEKISLPSLPFQLGFPDSEVPLHCEDEADLLPVLNLDNDLELSLAQSSAGVAGLSAETVLEDHVDRLEASSGVQRLHVMVCGFCHSVFHFIDQFIGHTHFCTAETNILTDPVSGDIRRTSEALAFILWSNTMLKLVREQVIVSDSDYDEISIRRSIKTKWFGLSGQLKEAWIRAAEVLNHLSTVSQGIMKPNEIVKRKVGDIPKEDEDVIHNGKTKPNIDSPDNKFDDVTHNCTSKQKHLHDHRDGRGRWASKVEPEKVKKFRCEPCNFEAPYEWKLNRHKGTGKHKELCKNVADAVDDSDKLLNVIEEPEYIQIGILDDEIESFDNLEYAYEKEFLHASPSDIIMEDS